MRSVGFFFLIALAGMLFWCGCEDSGSPLARSEPPSGPYAYTGYDSKGVSVVIGTISLTFVDSVSINGRWALKKNGPYENIGPQIGTGVLQGTVTGSRIFINLNPGWADNNVMLDGMFEGNQIQGSWSWVTLIGPTSGGTFKAKKNP